MSGAVSLDHVNIYQAGAHISGKLPSLYHYGNGAHIQLKISGTNFSGYDYGAGNHFSGRVSGNSISVYDYGEGGYFNYSI